MKKSLLSAGAFFVGLVVIMVVLVPSLKMPALVATLELKGGKCAQEGECSQKYYLFETGNITGDSFEDLTPSETAHLLSLAKTTDFGNLPVEQPEQRKCPSFVDGQDLSIKFADYGEKYTICQYKINEIPVFQYLLSVLQ